MKIIKSGRCFKHQANGSSSRFMSGTFFLQALLHITFHVVFLKFSWHLSTVPLSSVTARDVRFDTTI